MTDEAQLLYVEAEQCAVKRGLFKPAKPQRAIELFQRAGNIFKINKQYDRAGDSYLRAAQLQNQINEDNMSLTNIRSSINCFNLINSPRAKEALELLIDVSQRTGNFVQAGKAIIQQAQEFQQANQNDTNKAALDCYYRALDILSPEQNVDSDIRNIKENIANLEIKVNQNYIKAKEFYESIGKQCIKIKLLQFHARGYLLRAFLCIVCLEDEVAASDTCNNYLQIDPAMEGSPEGDFMKEITEAIEKGNKQEDFDVAYGKFISRTSVKGDSELRNLIYLAREKFKPQKEQVQEVRQEQQVESNQTEDKQDDDLL